MVLQVGWSGWIGIRGVKEVGGVINVRIKVIFCIEKVHAPRNLIVVLSI